MIPLGIIASRFGSGSPPVPQGWNPAAKDSDITLSGSDLVATISSALGSVKSITSRTPGSGVDRFAEITIGITSGGNEAMVGIGTAAAAVTTYPGSDNNGRGYYAFNGNKYLNGSGTAYGSSYGDTAVIGIRLNSSGDLIFYLNGSSQGTAYSVSASPWFLMFGSAASSSGTRVGTINTGQSPFAHDPGGVVAWG